MDIKPLKNLASFRITDDEEQLLVQIAKDEVRSKANLIRQIFLLGLKTKLKQRENGR